MVGYQLIISKLIAMTKNKYLKLTGILALTSVCLASCLKDYDNPADGILGSSMSVYALRQVFNGSEVTLSTDNMKGASKIQGVVISDKNGKNIDENSFVLQETIVSGNSVSDVTRGLVVRMNGAAPYNIGDSLRIDVVGARLSRMNGMLTLSGIGSEKIETLGTNKVPLSRPVTNGILNARMEEYESTLVTLHADVVSPSGTTLSGMQNLDDHTGAPITLRTLSTSAFASTALPVDAQFGGIANFYNESGGDTTGAKKVIMPRNAGDIQFVSGAMYAGFPESFESPDAATKASYNSGTNIVTLGTGNWYLLQAILGNTIGSDRINIPGKQNIRMQQNLTTSGYVQMNFDVPDGASKVTVFYGRYASDARSSFRLESSVNGGTTWTAVGATIVNEADKLMKQASWTVNFTGPVRFRINKLGTGTSNNGRLSLDDFAVYKKL